MGHSHPLLLALTHNMGRFSVGLSSIEVLTVILLLQILLDLHGYLKKVDVDIGSLTVKQWKRIFDSISFWSTENIMETCMAQNWTPFVMSFVREKCVF